MNQEKEEIVDVLMPTYNTDIIFLKIQIHSILNQTHKNIHLIISDDASTNEEIKKVLEQCAKKDKRVTLYFQEKNLGYLKNFEFLLEKSTADYIMYSDHDDIWYKEKIQKSLQTLKEKKVDLVYTDAEQIDAHGAILHESYIQYKNMPTIYGKNSILSFSRHIAIGCSQIFTKKIKEQMLPFSEDMMAHDWITVYLASKQNGVQYLPEKLFGYRLHESNEFGGRSLKQNLTKWKKENGKSYKAYKKYRNQAIQKAYQSGSQMCYTYCKKLNWELTKEEQEVLKYYEKIKNTKIINLNIARYKKYLMFKGIGKRRIKEIMLFHFPIVSYLWYLIG